MDTSFVVYLHFVSGEADPFYVGEGRLKRSKSTANRNRHWHFKVAKHGGFSVEIVAQNLTKSQAENMERTLIAQLRAKGVPLVNVCEGPMFEKHWLLGRPKEEHPMFGTKRTIPAVSESNRRRTGTKLKPRPDLVERNKTGVFKRYARPVQCVETGEIFPSITAASNHVGVHDSKIHRALKEGSRSGGLHWKYVTSSRS